MWVAACESWLQELNVEKELYDSFHKLNVLRTRKETIPHIIFEVIFLTVVDPVQGLRPIHGRGLLNGNWNKKMADPWLELFKIVMIEETLSSIF